MQASVDTPRSNVYNVHALNSKIQITEREFEMINVLAKVHSANQRELSSRAGMSLGMTNVVLKRLAKKGLLKIRQLNRRKVDYLLTSRGFSEKTKKSYRYMLKTIDSVNIIKAHIQVVLRTAMEKNRREFVMLGDGDFHDIVELAIRGMKSDSLDFRRVPVISPVDLKEGTVVLLADKKTVVPPFVKNHINLLDEVNSAVEMRN